MVDQPNPYLQLITSEHRKPKFVAWVATLTQPLVEAQALLAAMPGLLDIDNAVGDQLDKVGQWIGLTRFISEPLQLAVFSWDTPGAGWDQAVWAQPFQNAQAAIVRLDDEHYRMLLKVKILVNNWDGTVPSAYTAWEQLFGASGFQILIEEVAPKRVPYFSWDDPQAGWDLGVWYQPNFNPFASTDMRIKLGLVSQNVIDPLTLALFEGGYFDLKPAGVSIDYYMTQSVVGVPMFAWDTPGAGWDTGAWAILTPGG